MWCWAKYANLQCLWAFLSPDVGDISFNSSFIKVDFPAPLSPTIQILASGLALIDTSFKITLSLFSYLNLTSSNWTAAPPDGGSHSGNLKITGGSGSTGTNLGNFSKCFSLLWTWDALLALYLNRSMKTCRIKFKRLLKLELIH